MTTNRLWTTCPRETRREEVTHKEISALFRAACMLQCQVTFKRSSDWLLMPSRSTDVSVSDSSASAALITAPLRLDEMVVGSLWRGRCHRLTPVKCRKTHYLTGVPLTRHQFDCRPPPPFHHLRPVGLPLWYLHCWGRSLACTPSSRQRSSSSCCQRVVWKEGDGRGGKSGGVLRQEDNSDF